ncbi:unnamed protein product [Orchesella dallaii]|uniref:C2H2-type domain-containing protein n=1 Tax=Orchesella dallaii TaxID=48710 RepID=A0ABP1PSR3_9HEXA
MENFDFSSLPIVEKVNGTVEDMADFQQLIGKYTAAGYFDIDKPGLLLNTPQESRPNLTEMEKINEMSIGTPKEIYATTIIPGYLQLHYQDLLDHSRDKHGYQEDKEPLTIGEFKQKYSGADNYDDLSTIELQERYWSKIRDIGRATDGLFKAKKVTRKPKFLRLCVYATDVAGTLFPLFSQKVTLHNIPSILTEVTRLFHASAEGIDSPMMYIFVCDSTFPYHLEDIDLWSVNFHHFGSRKIWYVVPPAFARQLEELVNKDLEVYRSSVMHNCCSMLRHKNIFINVSLLKENNIPVYVIVQGPGDMIVLHPRAYHCGFSTGFGVAEATNFATKSWLPYGITSIECLELKKRITIEHFIYQFHFERYQEYIDGRMKFLDPISSELVSITPPQLQLVELQTLYTIVFQGITSILLPKTQEGKMCVLVEIAGEKIWLSREDAEKLKWRNTSIAVKLPDYFFDSKRTEPPPIWTYELAAQLTMKQSGNSSNFENIKAVECEVENAKSLECETENVESDWKAKIEAQLQDHDKQLQQLRESIPTKRVSYQSQGPSTSTCMEKRVENQALHVASKQMPNANGASDQEESMSNEIPPDPKPKRPKTFICRICSKGYTTNFRLQDHLKRKHGR